MKDIRISDHANWRHVHWNALLSAYGESPFFEYYQDDIRPFYEKKYEFLFDFNMETTAKMIELLDIRPKISVTDEYEFLFDFNMEITEKMIELLDIRPKISITNEYIQSEERKVKSEEFNSFTKHKVESIKDFREAIRPKKPLPDAEFESKRYYQVYEQKFGFQPNMSILDLLFNEGNEAIFYL